MSALVPVEALDDRGRDWWPLAACNDGGGSLAGLFFSDELQDIAAAKAVCRGCPVRVPCLEEALARREPWGVWGGELLLNGKVLAHKRKRGRPPKARHPEEAVDAARPA